jgi:hypothetical protein
VGKTTNLIYLSKSSVVGARFFNNLNEVRKEVDTNKNDGNIFNTLTIIDANEVTRGPSYAVFPALKQLFEKGGSISIKSIKEELNKGGVTDEVFQHKLLAFLLQSRLGLAFPLPNVINELLDHNRFTFAVDNSRSVELKIKGKNHVQLIYSGTLNDITEIPQKHALKLSFKIDITPQKVILNSFKITQLSDNELAKNAFSLLQENQVSLWHKFILWVKSFFTDDKDLEFENEATDNIEWRINTNQNESNDSDVEGALTAPGMKP